MSMFCFEVLSVWFRFQSAKMFRDGRSITFQSLFICVNSIVLSERKEMASISIPVVKKWTSVCHWHCCKNSSIYLFYQNGYFIMRRIFSSARKSFKCAYVCLLSFCFPWSYLVYLEKSYWLTNRVLNFQKSIPDPMIHNGKICRDMAKNHCST